MQQTARRVGNEIQGEIQNDARPQKLTQGGKLYNNNPAGIGDPRPMDSRKNK